jgi:hypothetical protein
MKHDRHRERPHRLRLDRKVLDTIAGWYAGYSLNRTATAEQALGDNADRLASGAVLIPVNCIEACYKQAILTRPGIPHAGPVSQYIAGTLFRSPQMWFIVSAALPSAGRLICFGECILRFLSGIEGKPKQLSIHGGEWNLPKAAPAKSGEPARKKTPADSTQPEAPNLEEFKNNPIKGAGPILRWRSREKTNAVLANADFAIGLKKLASDAANMPKAAVLLSQFALRPEYFSVTATAMETASAWPEPPNFKKAEDRRLAAEALERLRTSWALRWLAKALVGTQSRYPTLRLFFASRLILASGGLMGAVDALVKVQGGLKPKEQLGPVLS